MYQTKFLIKDEIIKEVMVGIEFRSIYFYHIYNNLIDPKKMHMQ